MSHLDIIKGAYEACGIIYTVKERDGYFYLVTSGDRKEEHEAASVDALIATSDFMEFDESGQIASY